jgi:hypothetical protein
MKTAIECCGKKRTTRFCPECGRRLSGDSPLESLLAHCEKYAKQYLGTAARFRKSAESHREREGNPHAGVGADAMADREQDCGEKWSKWAAALRAAMAKLEERGET